MSDVVHLDHFRRTRGMPCEPVFPPTLPKLTSGPIYKTLDRKKRAELWDKAEILNRFHDRFIDLAHVADLAFERYDIREVKTFAYGHIEQWQLFVERRTEVATQLMLTPAPTMAALTVKRRMRSQWWHGIDKTTAAKIDALIDADHAWLLANCGRRAKRRQS